MFIDFKLFEPLYTVTAYFLEDQNVPVLSIEFPDYNSASKVVENCCSNPRFSHVRLLQSFRRKV